MSDRSMLEELLQDAITDDLPLDPSRSEIRGKVAEAAAALWVAGYRRVDPRDEAIVESVAQAINAKHEVSHRLPWSHLVQSKDKANRDRVARDRAYARAVLAALETDR